MTDRATTITIISPTGTSINTNNTNTNNSNETNTSSTDTDTKKSILVNGFTFCLLHGDEFCPICACDHRMGNNMQVEEELGDVTELLEHEVEARQPINAYAHGAVAAVTTAHHYECETHHAVDCAACFDWVRIIQEEAAAAEEHGRWMGKRASLKAYLSSDFDGVMRELNAAAAAAAAGGAGAGVSAGR